jgi:hypothetical protein
MEIVEEISAFGHSLVRSTHKTTFEITKDEHLTKRGDCIIAIRANKSASDLSREFKDAAKKPNSEITIIIEVGGEVEIVKASGSPYLTFTHPTDMVVRKSSYVCGRTIAVKANKAACDLSREIIKKLQNPEQTIKIKLISKF